MNGGWLGRSTGRVVLLIIAALVGLAAGALGMLSSGLSPRNFILAAGSCAALVVAGFSSRPRCVLLFAWVVSLTYGKAFFVRLGDGTADLMGFYFILSDVFLFALLVHWVMNLLRRSAAEPVGNLSLLWFLPFLAVAVIATITAANVGWALFELLRLGKLALILVYMRFNLEQEEWWACIAGLAAATSAQALLSLLQVALGKTSAGIVGLVGGGESAEAAAQASAMQGAMGGWFRAYGTVGHPANLANYFLLTIPILLGLAFALPGRWRWPVLGSALLGLAGLACTQSRGPWVFGAIQVGLVIVGLVLFRTLPPGRAVLLVGGAAVLSVVLAVRFEKFIADRFTRDYVESVELRNRDIRTAYRIFAENPVLGVGLNNYAARILEYDKEWDWAIQGAPEFQRKFDSRVFVAPHNLFLFLMAETGILGLVAFCIWLVGIAWTGARALFSSASAERMVHFGVLLGLLGSLAQATVNFSLWVDPILFTTALTAALVASAPGRQLANPLAGDGTNEVYSPAHAH